MSHSRTSNGNGLSGDSTLPESFMYECLRYDENYVEYFVEGTLQIAEDFTQSMSLAAQIHEIVKNLWKLDAYQLANDDSLMTCMQHLTLYLRDNSLNSDDVLSESIYSAEVEIFKIAMLNAGIKKLPNQSEETQRINVIHEIIKLRGEYKDRLRVRKQKSIRMLKNSQRLSNDLLTSWGVFYCFRIELGFTLDYEDRFNVQKIIQFRSSFLARARHNSLFPDETRYIWFLDHHRQKGFFYHFYILVDPNFVVDHKVIADGVGQFWCDVVGRFGFYIGLHSTLENKEHRTTGVGVVRKNDPSEIRSFYLGLQFMCEREMYRKFHDSFVLETFRTGLFRNKKKIFHPSSLSAIDNFNLVHNENLSLLNRTIQVGHAIQEPLEKKFMNNVLLGYGTVTGQPIRWCPGALNNGFLLVTGHSGAGKTNTLKQICSQLSSRGTPVWVLDPHNQLNSTRYTSILLSDGKESTQGINPLMLYFADSARRGMFAG